MQNKLMKFIEEVDQILESRIGLSHLDLPDVDWYNYFDSDMDEEEMKEMAEECASDMIYDFSGGQ